MPIRSQMSTIMELSALELFALEFGKIAETDSIICKYRPVSSKLGQNIYVQQNLDRNNWRYLLLNLETFSAFDFVYSLASTNVNQSAKNLVTMYMNIRSQMSLIMG